MQSVLSHGLERLLVVGLGSVGSRHVRLVKQLLPGVEIIALRHREPRVSEPLVDRSVTSLADALKFRPQAAVISGPASSHVAMALPLARAGVHLLVEKPISDACQRVPELIEAAREHGTTLMTGYNLRFLPSLQRVLELLDARAIGRVLSVRAETGQFLPAWRPGSDYRETVSAQAALGGGVLLELSHEIDYLRWLFGEIDWVSATLRKQSNLEIDVEDTAHLVLSFAAKPGEIPVVASVNLDFVRHDTTRRCAVIGESGSLRWDAVAGTVEIFEQDGAVWQPIFARQPQKDESYVAEWHHFLACITEGGTPLVSGDDGLAVLKVIEAARRSSATSATVALRA